MSANQGQKKQNKGIKEMFRKFLVSLKRNPQNIPMFSLIIGFLYYSLNLTSISNTTNKINTSNMGQCEFAAMLLSILAIVVFLRCFPKRQKPNVAMIVVLVVMLVVMICTDSLYLVRINQAISRASDPIVVDAKTKYIVTAWRTMQVHMIFICITGALLATLPVYSKLLKKINTSIDVEDNGEMEAVELAGEDE